MTNLVSALCRPITKDKVYALAEKCGIKVQRGRFDARTGEFESDESFGYWWGFVDGDWMVIGENNYWAYVFLSENL